jgi:hypothetical protein
MSASPTPTVSRLLFYSRQYPSKMASHRMAKLLNVRVLPAARAAGTEDHDLIFELPDPVSLQVPLHPASNTYGRLGESISAIWGRYGEPLNPTVMIRIDNSLNRYPGGSASIFFSPNPRKAEFRNHFAYSGNHWRIDNHALTRVFRNHWCVFWFGAAINFALLTLTIYTAQSGKPFAVWFRS